MFIQADDPTRTTTDATDASDPAAAAGAASAQRPASRLAAATQALEAAVETLAWVDVDGEADRALLDGVVALQQLAERVTAGQVRLLGAVEQRQAYRHDGAVSTAAWLRARTRVDHGQAVQRVQAARRLSRLDELRAAFAAGQVTFAHVVAVTRAAVPRRMAAIAACDATLTALARSARPQDVRQAVQAIRDCADPDGSDSPPLDARGLDERRHLDVIPTIDRLVEVRGLLDQLQGERLLTVLDACAQPDPADTPDAQRRAAGQRRADALDTALTRLLDAGDVPVVQGNKPHVVCTIDLQTLLGLDEHATRRPRLRHTGQLDPDRARRLLHHAKLLALLTLGPWRTVNVGRTHRTLPAWLRLALELVHRHCRGPDCDRPISWTQAHHIVAWAAHNGDTDLHQTVPLCPAHHDMVTTGGWHVDLDNDNGTCTWHGPQGQTIHTHPPAP